MSNGLLILIKVSVHLGALLWLSVMFYWGVTDQLGGDPVKELIHFTGVSSLNFLLASLLITPIAKWTKKSLFLKFRRLLGLYSFFYGVIHLVFFIWLDLQLDLALLITEIVKRPYITIGMVAFSLLLALAITSVGFIKRKMGKSWQQLHNWVYVAAVMVIIHFYWSVKLDVLEPLVYGALLLWLLVLRQKKFQQMYRQKKAKH